MATPPLMQSKLLCVSLLYATITAFLLIYASLQPTKCLFRSSPSDPLHFPLFSYPPNYGEHKHAIATHSSNCTSPLLFSDYWLVHKELHEIIQNPSTNYDDEELRYMQPQMNKNTFGGNFTTEKRNSYLHHSDPFQEIPCGFFATFPGRKSDQIAMDKCRGVVVVSAIFNDHDKIRQPKSLGRKTLETVCFFMFVDDVTVQAMADHQLLSRKSVANLVVGVWRIVKISTESLYEHPAMNGMIPKYLIHRLFPNSKFSIWLDAKLQLMVDPLLLVHALVVTPKVDMAISRHPFFVHTMEEAMATARWKKWLDVDGLRNQMETYCALGLRPWSASKLPYPSDVPDSALIVRKHERSSNLLSCFVFNELEAFNPRDQIPFAFVRDKMRPKIKLNMFQVEVFEHVAVEYRHNLKKNGNGGVDSSRGRKSSRVRVRHHSFVNRSCYGYLQDMWAETNS